MSEPAWVALGPSVDASAFDAKVDKDAVVVAGTRLVATKLGASDTQPAFRIMGDGKHEWGAGGSTAPDVNLYRFGAGVLHVDGLFRTMHASPTGEGAFWSKVTSEATERFRIRADGFLQWGDGTTLDCVIRRDSAGRLTLDNTSFRVGRVAATDSAFASYSNTPGDTVERFTMLADGTMAWGPGNAARDTNLYRGGVDLLKTDDRLQVANDSGVFTTGSSAGQYAYRSYVGGEAQPRYLLEAGGYMRFGAGGSTVPDTVLYRAGVGSLKTDAYFFVGADLYAFGAYVHQPAADQLGLYFALQGSANAKFTITTPGVLSWGAGGASALDTNLYRASADNLKTDDSLLVGANIALSSYGLIQLTEVADPGGGAVNTVRLYSKDNGAGKTQIVAVWSTGAVTVIATQP